MAYAKKYTPFDRFIQPCILVTSLGSPSAILLPAGVGTALWFLAPAVPVISSYLTITKSHSPPPPDRFVSPGAWTSDPGLWPWMGSSRVGLSGRRFEDLAL